MNDLGGAFFPDGTWCHNDGRRDFYCQNHVCQTADAPRGRSLSLTDTLFLEEPVVPNERQFASLTRLASLPDSASIVYDKQQRDGPLAVGIVQTPDDADDQGYVDNDYVTVPGL